MLLIAIKYKLKNKMNFNTAALRIRHMRPKYRIACFKYIYVYVYMKLERAALLSAPCTEHRNVIFFNFFADIRRRLSPRFQKSKTFYGALREIRLIDKNKPIYLIFGTPSTWYTISSLELSSTCAP